MTPLIEFPKFQILEFPLFEATLSDKELKEFSPDSIPTEIEIEIDGKSQFLSVLFTQQSQIADVHFIQVIAYASVNHHTPFTGIAPNNWPKDTPGTMTKHIYLLQPGVTAEANRLIGWRFLNSLTVLQYPLHAFVQVC